MYLERGGKSKVEGSLCLEGGSMTGSLAKKALFNIVFLGGGRERKKKHEKTEKFKGGGEGGEPVPGSFLRSL